MRIYNGKNSTINVPLPNGERMSVEGKSISADFLPSTSFLSMIVTNFDYSELALIVSGMIEVNLCSSVQCCNGFIAYSVSEAVERFSEDREKKYDGNPDSCRTNPANDTPENRAKADHALAEFEEKKKKKKSVESEKTTETKEEPKEETPES